MCQQVARIFRLFIFTALLIVLSVSSRAQGFSSGSTGADGALDLAAGDRQIQLPESGVLHYTTINIPSGRTLTFKPNFRNTPVIMLAQGNVVIAGLIDIRGAGLVPGPGGFSGAPAGQVGFGPGGGGNCQNGTWIGSLSLVPIVGGSGAGSCAGLPGGGGGGAIAIASSTSIVLMSAGAIAASGGGSGYGCGGGSGGAIRLVANSIHVSGSLGATQPCGSSSPGVIRLEAPAGSLVYDGLSNPLPILSTTINPAVVSDNNTPSLTITHIGGFPVSYAAGRPNSVDLMLPNSITDPVSVNVQARNIPVGTQVSLNISGSPSASYAPGTLSGTQASSSTTLSVSGLSRSGATFILAYAEFTLPPETARYNSTGPDHVAKVRVEAALDGRQKFAFLRSNGSTIEPAKVPESIRKIFGQ